tara:strand:- start:299 stop:3325 length:3027 start_codon:yes stop_codon:yes gene_type:complete
MAITKIGTPELFDFSATNTALQLPTGDTASRPAAPSAGEWRFNTDKKYVEYWDGGSPGAWRQIDTEAQPNPDDFPSENFNVNTYFGNGSTQTLDAKFNEAANFGVSGSVINLSPGLDTFISSNAIISVSLWVKIHTQPDSNGQVIFSLGDSRGIVAPGQQSFSPFRFGAQYANSNTSQKMADAAFTLNTWTHVVGVLSTNSSDVKLYVDKVLQTTGGATDYLGLEDDACIGNRDNTGYTTPFKGAIDQVRIYPGTLTQGQINDLYAETTTTASTLNYPSGAGCVAAYQLDGDASDVGGTYGGVTSNVGYTGLKFQADLIWIKSRNAPADHTLTDSVRGVQQLLSPNTNALEGNQSPNGMTNFGANSFSVTDVSTGGAGVNGPAGGANSGTPPGYVAWCFKAGGAPTATNSAGAGNVPTAGSVKIDGADSTVADAGTTPVDKQTVNTKNGLSITTYTPSGGAYTVSHGFTSAPDLIIVKGVSATEDWLIYNSYSGTGKYLSFNRGGGTEALQTRSNSFSAVTSTTFTDNWTSASLQWVAYCFKNIDGYQRVGTYTGDGNTSGNFVYTTSDGTASGTDGFEPAFLLLKNTTTAGTSWLLYDNKRTPTNPIQTALIAGSNGADVTSSSFKINFFTNGFEVTGNGSDINGSGDTFIYLAIAADKDTSVPTQANSFSPTIYTGDGGTQSISTPLATDFTWIKNRTNAYSHQLYDSVRGTGSSKNIQSDKTFQQGVDANLYGFISSFDPNGFTVQSGTSTGNTNIWTNQSGEDYVAWNWKAGGLPTINNDGSTTSIVSVNQAAGFSIVRYRGNSAANQTVGHGLGTGNIPKLIIFKKFTGTSDWPVYSSALTDASYNLYLNKADAQVQNNNPFNGTAPTDTVFTVEQNAGNVNDNGQDIIAYCFADVTGYQKVGSYAGNLTTPPSITTGFSPRFLIIKKIDNGTGPWVVIDSARAPTNPASARLRANASDTEYSNSAEAIYRSSTEFTVGTVGNLNTWDGMNANSTNYLYFAIA